MHRKIAAHLSTLAIGVGLGVGAVAVASPDPTARSSASDAEIVRELRRLNANVGNRFRDAPIITQLSAIKRSTKATCEAVRASEHIVC